MATTPDTKGSDQRDTDVHLSFSARLVKELQEEAREQALSLSAYIHRLIEKGREARRKQM